MAWAPVITASGKPLFIPRNGVVAPAWALDADCADCCAALCVEVGSLCACLDAGTPTLSLTIAGHTNQTYVKPCGNPPNCDPATRISEEITLEILWANFNGTYVLDYNGCGGSPEGGSFSLSLYTAPNCVANPESGATTIRANGILVARESNVDCPGDGITNTTLYEAELYIREIAAGVFCVSESVIGFNRSILTNSVWRKRASTSDPWGNWNCGAFTAGTLGEQPEWVFTKEPVLCDFSEISDGPFCQSGVVMTQTGDEERIEVDGDDCITNLNACPDNNNLTYTAVLNL